MDDSVEGPVENRDESMHDIFSAKGTQFSVSNAEADAREGMGEKEMDSLDSPVDCHGFPDEECPANQWPDPDVEENVFPSTTKDTVDDGKDTVVFNKDFCEWQLSNPPPPPPTKPPIPTMSPSPMRVKHILDKNRSHRSVNQTEATEATSFETPCQSFVADGSTFFVGTPYSTKDDASFVDSVGNVTMDAFGFPITETSLPPKSPGTSFKSVKGSVPMCPRDSPAKGMRPTKSDPALNRLISHAHLQAHYREPSPVEFEPKTDAERASATDSTQRKLDIVLDLLSKIEAATDSRDEDESSSRPASVVSKSFHESTPVERKLNTAKELLNKAKSIVTDDDVDKMLGQIEDPNKSTCESDGYGVKSATDDDDTGFGVTSNDDTNPVMNTDINTSFFPKATRAGSPQSLMEGSFDVQESSIELMESSFEIPLRITKTKRSGGKQRASTRIKCSDDNVYCNINFAEVEKAMWELMDILDEKAGKCAYVVGCFDRIPNVVNTSVNDTFSLLEDESLLNQMATQQSVSMLDSLTVDE